MANARRISARVFLEGIEVPNQGVSIEGSVNSQVNATINLVPGNYVKKLLPRTLIHIMVQDPFGEENKWYMAFEGEYIAKQYKKTAGSKTVIASVIDYSSYFDQAKSYFFNAKYSGVQSNDPNVIHTFTESTKAAFKDQTVMKTSLTATNFLLNSIAEKVNKTGELTDAIKEAFREFSNGNAFLRLAESRLRITDRLVSETVGDGIKAALTRAFAGSAIDNMVNEAMQGTVTLRELLITVLQYMFNDMICMPFPSLVAAASDVKYPLNGKTIASMLIKPNIHFLPPPKCNVIFPSMYTDLSFAHNYLHDVTRVTYRPEIPSPPSSPDVQAVGQNYVYYPDSYAAFMGNKPQPSIGADSELAVANVYGEFYKTEMSIKKFCDPSNDGEKPLTDSRIHFKIRSNDFLTNEEAIRGIMDASFSTFPGIGKIVGADASDADKKNYFEKICEYLFFKTRFEHRTIPVSIAYNPHVAIGFPIAIIDDSVQFNNTIVGYLQSVSHSITPQGVSTNLMITYARELDEINELTGSRVEPPMPPWFDPARWGSVDKEKTATETQNMKKDTEHHVDEDARANGVIQFDKVSDTYKKLLGCDSITDSYSSTSNNKRGSTEGAVAAVIVGYRRAVASGDDSEREFIKSMIRRPLVDMESAFLFLNAAASVDSKKAGLQNDFTVFKGTTSGPAKANTFDGILTDAQKTTLYGAGFEYLTNKDIIAKKQSVVQQYADELKFSPGQRG